MTARDRFKAKLKCPNCGAEGVASLSQADGYAWMRGERGTTVEEMPDGFKFVPLEKFEYEIHCVKCGVNAET